jgi:UDP-N-acetylglucosamine 2-epimerase (non-hydrolysing)
MKPVLEKVIPDIVIVQGDTTSAFASSLAAYYLKIPIAHVEAGLRTFNKYQPYPEEINRRMISHIVDLHFAPTQKARENLLSEGIDKKKIFVTGNTVVDTLQWTLRRINKEREHIRSQIRKILPLISFDADRVILVTGHRRENFGEGLNNICRAILNITRIYPDIQIVYPVHYNPNVREKVFNILGGKKNIHLVEPLRYELFVYLMDLAHIILTDSGGVQEEAPSLGRPVLIMRNVTERTEALDAGVAKLVGTDPRVIVSEIRKLLEKPDYYAQMSRAKNPYGDGKASARIIRILKKYI